MMPQGSPVGFGSLARAAQAYAYHLQRGGDEAGARRAAAAAGGLVNVDRAAELGAAAREAARVIGLRDPANAGWFNLQRSQASTPGATTEVYTVAVLLDSKSGGQRWRTVQVQVGVGESYASVLAAIDEAAEELGNQQESSTEGTFVRWEAQTVIGHTPGVG